MRLNLGFDDIGKRETTRAIPVETVGQLICEFKAAIEALHTSLDILIEEVKGLRQDMKAGVNKSEEGLRAAEESAQLLKELTEALRHG